MRIVTIGIVFLACLVTGIGCAKELNPRTPAEIQAAIQAERPALETCYAAALERNRDLNGEVSIVVFFDAGSSKAKSVHVSSSRIDDPTFKECVVASLRTLEIREAANVPVEGYYTLSFIFSDGEPAVLSAPAPGR